MNVSFSKLLPSLSKPYVLHSQPTYTNSSSLITHPVPLDQLPLTNSISLASILNLADVPSPMPLPPFGTPYPRASLTLLLSLPFTPFGKI
jgi:hypothetical protein